MVCFLTERKDTEMSNEQLATYIASTVLIKFSPAFSLWGKENTLAWQDLYDNYHNSLAEAIEQALDICKINISV